jgi:pheromone shutdown protein TraB
MKEEPALIDPLYGDWAFFDFHDFAHDVAVASSKMLGVYIVVVWLCWARFLLETGELSWLVGWRYVAASVADFGELEMLHWRVAERIENHSIHLAIFIVLPDVLDYLFAMVCALYAVMVSETKSK